MKKQPQKLDTEFPVSDAKSVNAIGRRFSSAQPGLTKTTFQLTEEGYKYLNGLAEKKGSNVAAVLAGLADFLNGEFLGAVVEACIKSPTQGKRIRRSYSIGRQTLDLLRKIQKKNEVTESNVSRDDLIEAAARFATRLFELYEKGQLEKVKEARDLYQEFGEVLNEWCGRIGGALSDYPEHGIHNRLDILQIIYDNLALAIEDEIEKGIPVDPSDI